MSIQPEKDEYELELVLKLPLGGFNFTAFSALAKATSDSKEPSGEGKKPSKVTFGCVVSTTTQDDGDWHCASNDVSFQNAPEDSGV